MASTSKGPEDATTASRGAAGTAAASPTDRAPWVTPKLEKLGDVRDLTMGGSPGVFESNNPGQRKPKT